MMRRLERLGSRCPPRRGDGAGCSSLPRVRTSRRPPPRLPRDNLLVYRGAGRQARAREDGRRLGEAPGRDRPRHGIRDGQAARRREALPARHEGRGGGRLRDATSAGSSPTPRSPARACRRTCSSPRTCSTGKKKAPAVLCLHGTDNVVGHGTVVGLGNRPNRGYAAELAERGYVTLAPNYPLLAKYQPDLKKLGWESGTLKAVWDNMRGLDLLESLPFVDARRVRDDRPLARRAQLGLHRRVRRPPQGGRVELRARLVPRLLRRRREELAAREGLVPDALHAASWPTTRAGSRTSRSTSTR